MLVLCSVETHVKRGVACGSTAVAARRCERCVRNSRESRRSCQTAALTAVSVQSTQTTTKERGFTNTDVETYKIKCKARHQQSKMEMGGGWRGGVMSQVSPPPSRTAPLTRPTSPTPDRQRTAKRSHCFLNRRGAVAMLKPRSPLPPDRCQSPFLCRHHSELPPGATGGYKRRGLTDTRRLARLPR